LEEKRARALLCASTLKVPKQFSARTMIALDSGKKVNITDAVRQEIVQATVTLVMVHTLMPYSQEYTVMAEKLVTEYPILADVYGCGFVSMYISDVDFQIYQDVESK